VPTIIVAPSIAAGAAVNVIAGQQYEFIPAHSHVEIAAVTPLTGCLMTVYAGTDLLLQESPVDIKAASLLPVFPDNFHVNEDVLKTDRLNVTIRNTTGAPAVVTVVARINTL